MREQDADRRAIEALIALGYDPESVRRYLRRLQRLVEQGDPHVAEIALAHPTLARRLQIIEEVVSASPQSRVTARVNREVFRRAAGHKVLSTRLERVEGSVASADAETEGQRADGGHRRFWLLLALGALSAVLGFVVWQLL